MAIDLKSLGTKLSKYRELLMSSLDHVASSTGIDATRLQSIEFGQIEPTGDEVLILADFYRCDFKHFISNERVAPFEQTETLNRAHGDDFTKEDRRSIQDFLYLLCYLKIRLIIFWQDPFSYRSAIGQTC